MLISKVDIENGSLIDKISGSLATKTGSVIGFKKSDIGLVLSNDGTTANYVDIVGSESYTNSGDWSVFLPCYLSSNSLAFISKFDTSGGWCILNSGTRIYLYYYTTGSVIKSITIINGNILKKWFYLGVIYVSATNTFYAYRDNNLIGISTFPLISNAGKITLGRYQNDNTANCLNGSIGTPSIYNHALSKDERDDNYVKFLQSFNTGLKSENQRMFDRPKPKYDNDSNVLAHYTFENISSGVMTNKRGTGLYNGTCYKTLTTKNGLAFNNNAYVDCGNLGLSGNVSYFIHLKIKPYTITGFHTIIDTNDWWGQAVVQNAATIKFIRYTTGQITATTSNVLAIGKETTITLVYNNSSGMYVYINGILAVSTLTTGSSAYYFKYIGKKANNGDYYNGEIYDVVFGNIVPTIPQIKQYHNSFRKPQLISKYKYDGADGNVLTPIGYSNGTGVGKIGELTSYVNSELGIGDKYFEFTTAGTLLYKGIDLSSFVNNGYIDYWYMPVGTGVWVKRSGYLNAPVTGIGYASNTLTFIGANIGDRIANAVIHNQILI